MLNSFQHLFFVANPAFRSISDFQKTTGKAFVFVHRRMPLQSGLTSYNGSVIFVNVVVCFKESETSSD